MNKISIIKTNRKSINEKISINEQKENQLPYKISII